MHSNAYLAEVQLNAPAGPVTAQDLTTTSTAPTIGGTVTLAAGETFSVIVDGQTYTTSNGVTFDGSGNWQLTLPVTPLGTYTITAVITNALFYTLTDAGTLVINNCTDPDVPTLTGDFTGQCQGGNTTLNISGNLNDALAWYVYTDSCGGTLVGTTSANAFIVSPTVNTTYYIRGEGGCVVPGLCAEVTVTMDTTPPVAVCQDFTAELDATGNVNITAGDIDNGSSDDCSIASITLDITSFTCADLGDNTVTLTVTDSNGNTDTCTATVTVEDNLNPAAVGQDITVQLDATGNATITTADIDNGSSDNCGAPTLGLDVASFGCADVGPNTVTLTATDGSGNSDSTTATVTVEDNIDPTAVCQDITIQLDASGNASIVAGDIDNGSSDNCSVSLSADVTSFTAADLGANTVTLTVTDPSGNTAVCTAVVTVQDNIAPVAVCQDFTVALDATGNATIVAGDIDNGSSDNDSVASLSLDTSSFTCADLGANTVTLTVTDPSGNSSTCTATVTVEDNLNPAAVGQDITVQLDATGNATITTADIDNGSSDNCGAPTLGLDVASFGCADVGPNTVTLTATDGSGNSDSTTATVTVEDNIDPTAVCQDITIQLDASGNASIVAGDIDNGSSDNCSVSLSADVTSFTAADLGANTVTLTVTDPSGNTAVCTAVVTVQDNIAPVAVCQDFTVALDATGNATIVAGDIDNGSSDNDSVASLSLDTSSFTCADLGTNTVTLTVTDPSGNSSTCTATVTVEDNLNPAAVGQDITVQLDATGNATITTADIDNGSSDNCGAPTLGLDVASFGCADVGPNTVTLTATDGSGNSDSTTATVTVEDNIDPTAVCQDITIQLDASGNASIVAGDIDNGSSDNCSVSLSADVTSFTAADLGANTVTLTVTDPSGNTAVCTAVVTVQDNIAPVAVCQDFTVALDATGNATIVAGDIDNGSSDNDSVASLSLDTSSFTCADLGTNTVTLTVTDPSGNSSTCTATVTVEDNINPTAVGQDITVQLDATGNATITTADIDNGSSDNCGIVNQSLDITAFTCADLGPNAVVYTVEDSSGNQDGVTVTITVEDNLDPTVVTQNITVELDATGNVSIAPADVDNGTADNCSVTSLTLDITAFDCNDVGNNTVTLTAVDQSSNTASATATVTVQDNIAPTVVTQDITVNLDGMGMATIVPADIDNGSTDNCTIDTYSLDIDSFDCDDVGPNTVILTVVDVNGNSAQATAVVTVVDVTPPVIVCAPDVVTIMDPGVCYAEVFFADAIALDECGIASVVQTGGPASGSLFTQGVTTIEYTATDVNGNTTVCSFTVTIQDTQIPTIASADDIAVSNDLGICGAFVNVPAPTITDNCSLDPAPVVDGPVTQLLGAFQLVDTPSTVAGLSNSIGGDVTAVVTYNGDWSSGVEDFDLRGPDGSQVFFRDNQGVDCPGTDFADAFSISESTWNGWITTYGSDLTFTLLADTAVNPGLCNNNFYQLSFTLGNGALLVNDYNGTADASDEYPVGTTVVTWTFTDIGGNVVTDTQTITVTDDEAPEMICIGEPGTFSITEDFEGSGLPNGWTNTALRGTDVWTFGSPLYVAGLGQGFPSNAAVFDDDAAGSGNDNAVELASPVYNMSGAASATLSFDYAYNYLSPNEFFSVEVYDGAQWVEILRLLEDHTPTNTGALDMLPYANDSFQVRFTYDDGGSGWKWGVGIDNFQLDYDIPSTPLTIALDANGNATLDVSQLLLSATDNCGPVSTSIGGGAVPGSLSTTFADGNGGSDGGAVYFDVTAATDLTVESLQMHIQDAGAFTVEVYAIVGDTYVGNETNAGAWTLISNGSGDSNSSGTPSDVTLDTALSLNAGTTYAMALVLDATHSHRYTNGDGTNENFSDANLSISLGSASNVPFSGTIFSPRVFNGTFNYFVGTPPSTTVDFDCSNLGDNLIEVTAIDSAGNVSTCISTVEVIDVTDPILVCQDATVSLDENGMAEVLPEFFINTDASFDACGITITAVDVTDVTCADIGIPITVTVFVSDASGNIASCQATMTVVDDMGPLLIDCPEDMTVDPGALDLFYEVPDYTVDVTATDNCTDPVGVISQDPPAGTLLPDGVYTITLSATDNEGNVGSCSFELTVESVLGAASNQLSAGVEIYPNPARKVMNIGNSSNVQLQRALIYDINGRLIQSVDLGNMDREASVNVANLASGVYLVQLEAEGATAIKRLIKE